MKKNTTITNVVAGLLGLLFLVFGLNFFLQFMPVPPPPEGSPAAAFLGSLYGSGYLAFVKVLEIAGGIALAIPFLRRLGLLLLGPVIVNILAFGVFFTNGASLVTPPVLVIILTTLYLLWAERGAFITFLKSN
jgi:putative oxidoreductase